MNGHYGYDDPPTLPTYTRLPGDPWLMALQSRANGIGFDLHLKRATRTNVVCDALSLGAVLAILFELGVGDPRRSMAPLAFAILAFVTSDLALARLLRSHGIGVDLRHDDRALARGARAPQRACTRGARLRRGDGPGAARARRRAHDVAGAAPALCAVRARAPHAASATGRALPAGNAGDLRAVADSKLHRVRKDASTRRGVDGQRWSRAAHRPRRLDAHVVERPARPGLPAVRDRPQRPDPVAADPDAGPVRQRRGRAHA